MQSQVFVTSNEQLLGNGIFHLPFPISGVYLQPRKINIYINKTVAANTRVICEMKIVEDRSSS